MVLNKFFRRFANTQDTPPFVISLYFDHEEVQRWDGDDVEILKEFPESYRPELLQFFFDDELVYEFLLSQKRACVNRLGDFTHAKGTD